MDAPPFEDAVDFKVNAVNRHQADITDFAIDLPEKQLELLFLLDETVIMAKMLLPALKRRGVGGTVQALMIRAYPRTPATFIVM